MTDPIDDYAARLTQALRQRGSDDPRIVAEAREHLVDAVADGRRRGLSLEEAEREAFERFGAPETIAAHTMSPGEPPMSRLTSALDTLWQRKWWVLAPTVVTALVTSATISYLLPARYRSEATLLVTAPRPPADLEPFVTAERARPERLREMSQLVLSRTRLEGIITEFGLYSSGDDVAPATDIVNRMRGDIAILPINDGPGIDTDGIGFRVSFDAADPKIAMRVTARIASLFIEENLHDRQSLFAGLGQFLDSQIADTRARIIDYEKRLDQLRAAQGQRPLSRADLLPYEVLQESYKTLLIRAEDHRVSAGIARRQIGEQFRIVDPPSLPEQPVGPSRLEASGAGAFIGLSVGILLAGLRSRSTQLAT